MRITKSTQLSLFEKIIFYTWLHDCMSSGISLSQSLEIIPYPIRLKLMCKKLASHVRAGKTLSASCEHEQAIPRFETQLIHTGESTGSLTNTLLHLKSYTEEIQKIRQGVIQALWYPGLVCMMAVLLFGVFLGVLRPSLQRSLHSASAGSRISWQLSLLALTSCGALCILAFIYRKTILYHITQIPVFRTLNSTYAFSLLYRQLGICLQSGMSAGHAVQSASKTTEVYLQHNDLNQIADQLLEGKTFSTAFAPLLQQYNAELDLTLILLGEKTGRLSATFVWLMNHHTKQFQFKLHRIQTVLPTILLLFSAALVALFSLHIIKEIYSQTQLLVS